MGCGTCSGHAGSAYGEDRSAFPHRYLRTHVCGARARVLGVRAVGDAGEDPDRADRYLTRIYNNGDLGTCLGSIKSFT